MADSGNRLGQAVIEITGDSSKFDAAIDSSKQKMDGFTTSIQGLIQSLGAAGLSAAITKFAKSALDAAGQFQMYQASFETMMGSAKKASEFIEAIRVMAAKTPFEMSGLAEAAKLLMQYNVAQEDIMPTMKALGDIAQGNNQRFQSLAFVYGQISSTGRLMGQDLIQMINAGFNPLQVISQKTGKSMGELKEQMQKGAISADMVKEAIMSATQEGGKFYNGMEKASKTIPGLASTLQDDITMMKKSFGDLYANEYMDLMKGLSGLAQKVTDMDKGTKAFIATMALCTAGALALIPAIKGVELAVHGLSAAFNTMKAANPWLLIAAGAGVLIASMISLKKAMDIKAEEALWVNQAAALESNKNEAESLAKEYETLKSKSDLTATEQKRLSDISDQLHKLYPDLTKETIDLAVANGTLTEAVDKAAEAQKKSAASIRLNTVETQIASVAKANVQLEDSLEGLTKLANGPEMSIVTVNAQAQLRAANAQLKSNNDKLKSLLTERETLMKDLYSPTKPASKSAGTTGNTGNTSTTKNDLTDQYKKATEEYNTSLKYNSTYLKDNEERLAENIKTTQKYVETLRILKLQGLTGVDKALNDATTSLTELKSVEADKIVGALKDMGYAGASYVESLVNTKKAQNDLNDSFMSYLNDTLAAAKEGQQSIIEYNDTYYEETRKIWTKLLDDAKLSTSEFKATGLRTLSDLVQQMVKDGTDIEKINDAVSEGLMNIDVGDLLDQLEEIDPVSAAVMRNFVDGAKLANDFTQRTVDTVSEALDLAKKKSANLTQYYQDRAVFIAETDAKLNEALANSTDEFTKERLTKLQTDFHTWISGEDKYTNDQLSKMITDGMNKISLDKMLERIRQISPQILAVVEDHLKKMNIDVYGVSQSALSYVQSVVDAAENGLKVEVQNNEEFASKMDEIYAKIDEGIKNSTNDASTQMYISFQTALENMVASGKYSFEEIEKFADKSFTSIGALSSILNNATNDFNKLDTTVSLLPEGLDATVSAEENENNIHKERVSILDKEISSLLEWVSLYGGQNKELTNQAIEQIKLAKEKRDAENQYVVDYADGQEEIKNKTEAWNKIAADTNKTIEDNLKIADDLWKADYKVADVEALLVEKQKALAMGDAQLAAGNSDLAESYWEIADGCTRVIDASRKYYTEQVNLVLESVGQISKESEATLRDSVDSFLSRGGILNAEVLKDLQTTADNIRENNDQIAKLEVDLSSKIIKQYDSRERAFLQSEFDIVESWRKAGRDITEINAKIAEMEWFHEIDNQIEDTYTNITRTVSGSTLNQIRMWEEVKEAIKKNTDYTADQIADKTKKVDTIIADLKNKLPNYADEITKITGSAYEKQILGIKESKDKNLQSLEDLKKDELASLDDQLKKELSKEGSTEEEKTKIHEKYAKLRAEIDEKYSAAGAKVTQNANEEIKKSNDEMIQKILSNGNNTSSGLMNQLMNIGNNYKSTMTDIKEFSDQAMAAAGDDASAMASASAASAAMGVVAVITAAIQVATAVQEAIAGVINGTSKIIKSLADISLNARNTADVITDIGDSLQSVGEIADSIGSPLGKYISSIGKVVSAVGNLINTINDINLEKKLKPMELIKTIGDLESQIMDNTQKGMDIIYDEQVDKINKATQEQLQALGFVDEFGNDLLDKQHDADLKAIEDKKQAELEAAGLVDKYGNDLIEKRHKAQLDDIDAREKAELASLGVLDKTESQKLVEQMSDKEKSISQETSVRKKAVLIAELAELKSEKVKADTKAKYEAERQAAERAYDAEKQHREEILFQAQVAQFEIDKKYEDDKAERDKITYDNQLKLQAAESDYQKASRKFLHDRAIAERDMALNEALIAKEKAIHDAAKDDKAAIEAEYNRVIASIQSLPIPPAAAQGGVVMPTNGGRIVRVAEAGVPEAIIPLDRLAEVVANVRPQITQNISTADTGDIHLVVNLDEKPILEKIFPATRNRTVKIDARSIVGSVS